MYVHKRVSWKTAIFNYRTLFTSHGWTKTNEVTYVGASLTTVVLSTAAFLLSLPLSSLSIRVGAQLRIMFIQGVVEVEATLRLTVSQSVCLGVEPTLGLGTRYYFLSECCCLKVAVLFLWGALSDQSMVCGAPSLTRGRVCNLQCSHSVVRVAQNR
jgi:hypothetical protein